MFSPNFTMLSGTLSFLTLVPRKALAPISFTPSSIVTFESFPLLQNASSSMILIVPGKKT